MAGYSIFQPEISKNYGKTEWREDLKNVMRQAGGQGKPTVFLMADSQIKEESFLEDVDNRLNTGEVPNLFAPDEKAELMEAIRPVAQAGDKNADFSPLALLAFFVNRCKENLHIVLAFSPIGDVFRNRLRHFPSLINCCTIDWFQAWPEDALQRVAMTFIDSLELPEQLKSDVVSIVQYFHTSVIKLSERFLQQSGRYNYVTPTSYLELLQSFKSLITQKQTDVMKAKKRYIGGLDKLAFAATQVAQMQKELEDLKPLLIQASIDNEKLMLQIQKESVIVEETSQRVRAEEAVANEQAAQSKQLKNECEADLAEALPALEAAIAALDTLKPSDITLLRTMQSPPFGVKLVMEAICVLRAVKPEKMNDPAGTGKKIFDYWGPSKKLLGDLNFLKDLKEYDKVFVYLLFEYFIIILNFDFCTLEFI